jgi:hypothetical protein
MVQQQLCTWVSWHSNQSKGRVTQSSSKATRFLKELLQSHGGRTLTEAEMYSRHYYTQCIRPSVEALIKQRNSTTRGERLTIIRDCTRQCWEKESNKDIIADIKAKMVAAKSNKKTKKGVSDEDERLDDEDEDLTEEEMIE